MKNVTIKYSGAETRYKAGRVVAARMRDAAEATVKGMKQDVGKQYPPASRPRAFPAKRSGRFQKSIKFRTKPANRGIDLFSDDPKAIYLEYGTRFMAPRPTFRKAERKYKAELDRAFRTKGKGTTVIV